MWLRSKFCLLFFLFTFLSFGSIHIQNLPESQGWRQLRLYARSCWCVSMVFGLLASALDRSLSLQIRRADRRPRQTTRMPSVPVQALGVSALWLYVLDGTIFFKASLRGPTRKRGLGL